MHNEVVVVYNAQKYVLGREEDNEIALFGF